MSRRVKERVLAAILALLLGALGLFIAQVAARSSEPDTFLSVLAPAAENLTGLIVALVAVAAVLVVWLALVSKGRW